MKREWDDGTYHVVDSQSGEVAWLLVIGDPIPGKQTVEHWVLTPKFKSPDGVRTSSVVRSPVQFSSESSFLTEMRRRATSMNETFKYVVAVCTVSTIKPGS